MIGETSVKTSENTSSFPIESYFFPLLVLLFIAFKFYKNIKNKKVIPELIKNGAIIIDVRSEAEFSSGHNPNSLNIPLDRLSSRIEELDKNKSFILCCASGIRSGTALALLKSKGFQNLYNAGAWSNTQI